MQIKHDVVINNYYATTTDTCLFFFVSIPFPAEKW